MNPERIHSLHCVVLVALDELRDLIDPDPAAAYANRAARDAIACLEHDWLGALEPVLARNRSGLPTFTNPLHH